MKTVGKRLMLCALVMMLASAFASGAGAQAATPAPDAVLEKYVTALGGKAAIEKINSRLMIGTWEARQDATVAAGDIEIYSKAPNKSGFEIIIEGFGSIGQGFNGTAAWSQNPQVGLRDLAGEELESAKRGGDFYFAVNFKNHFATVTVLGAGKAMEKDAWIVETTTQGGTKTKYVFDQASGLLLQTESQRQSPQGMATVTNTFEDYRDVDGVKIAFLRRQLQPTFPSVIKLTEVKHNVAIDDKRFEKPAK